MAEEKKKEPVQGKEKVKTVREKKTGNNTKLKEENEKLNDKVLRLSAEMQNMKRRFDDDLAKCYKYEGEELIKKLLPIVDNFERAIKLDDDDLTDELSKFLEGFKMIYTNLLNVLSSYEIKEIECLKQVFDPNLMEAVLTDSDPESESGTVLEVLQKGYMYKDKVIRIAMVKVNE